MFIFPKIPKNIQFQNSDPKKMTRAYVCIKISEYPLDSHPTPTPRLERDFKCRIYLTALSSAVAQWKLA